MHKLEEKEQVKEAKRLKKKEREPMREVKRAAKQQEKLKKLQLVEGKDQEYHLRIAQGVRDIAEGKKKLGSTGESDNQEQNREKNKAN